MKTKILYVDYASKGNSGFYSFNILNQIEGGHNVDAYLHKTFNFKLTNNVQLHHYFGFLERFSLSGMLGKFLSFIELYLVFTLILIKAKLLSRNAKVVTIINLHQSFSSFLFLSKYISKYSSLYLTIHDAVELQHNYPGVIMCDRDEIIACADNLIVHTEESLGLLSKYDKNMIRIPFPLPARNTNYSKPLKESTKVKFLFIGNIRKEKGLKNLLSAWLKIQDEVQDSAMLTVAGMNASGLIINEDVYKGIDFNIGFLEDCEFESLIKEHDYVIMPYVGGTNSGVLAESTALSTPVITSGIDMFKNNPLVNTNLQFNLPDELNGFILTIINKHELAYKDYLFFIDELYLTYVNDFRLKVNSLYCEMNGLTVP